MERRLNKNVISVIYNSFYLQMPSRIYKDAEHSGTHGGHAQQLGFQQNLLQFIGIGGQFVPLQTHVKITVLGFLQG